MKSRRPYMLRAMHEWISDSDCTPHIVVDAAMKGVDVPRQYVRDGKIVLNLSWNATAQLSMGSDEISFNGRFGGASMTVRIPMDAVLAVYARETGQGMALPEDAASSGPHDEPPTPDAPPEDGSPAPRRGHLRVIK